MYLDDRTGAAIAAMKKAGLMSDTSDAGVFAKRVFTCVARLLKEFFSQTHTPFSSEFALGLFDRLARGKPITVDFLKNQQKRLEAVAKEEGSAPSKRAEEDAWLADRYGLSPKTAALIIQPLRKDATRDSYGFPKNDDIMAQKPWINLDEYGSQAAARLEVLQPIAEASVPQDDIEDEDAQDASASEEEKKDMCLPDNDLVRVVRGVVEELCDDLKSFTAIDVSNAVKRAGHAYRHREIAPIVREMYADDEMDSFGYTRELITVSLPGGRQAKAWLYHHQTSDPAEYDTRAQVALPPKPQAAAPAAPPPPPVTVSTTPSTPQVAVTGTTKAPGRSSRMLNTASASRVQKLDGRLEVPRSWIKKLGWTEGDRIDAVQDGNAVVLKPYADVAAGEEVVYRFTVDRWNRIRVTNRALSKAGINTGGAHVVTLQNGSVKVE